jgi:GNAT superfamily N-acetyltransferase
VEAAYTPYIPVVGRRPGPMDFDYARLIGDECVYVADGQPPPGVVVLIDEADSLLLQNVAVHPEAQGRGVGHGLISFAEREALARGFERIRLYTNERMMMNLALYHSLGYQETARMTEEGFARVYMAKQLSSPGPG